MKPINYAAVCLVAATLAGCAHPMTMAPDIKRLVPATDATAIPKNVGLVISAANRDSEVTTAGGGGDKVSYHPYADMETGLYTVLGNVFPSVTVLKSPTDAPAIAQHSAAFVIEPRIVTSSSSNGVFTWMATDFTVMLEFRVTDADGKAVTTLASTGNGHAVFDELKKNFSLAGERASTDALQKMQVALLQSPELRK